MTGDQGDDPSDRGSRCHGIWFGYTLEAECPVCGNRKG